MEEAWRRIITWYEANTPPGTLRLPPGALETSVQAAERQLGFVLPADLRAFYRLHDGLGGAKLVHYGSFHSVAQMVDAWHSHRRLEQLERVRIMSGFWTPIKMSGPIRPEWWSAKRALITNIGGTDCVMVDIEPAPGGTIGQLIEFDHELGPQCVVAPSFTIWLQQIALGLEAGKLVWDTDEAEVAPRGYYEHRESLNNWMLDSAESSDASDRPT